MVSRTDLPLRDVTAQLSALQGRRLDAGVGRRARRGQVVTQTNEGRDPPAGGRHVGFRAPRGRMEAQERSAIVRPRRVRPGQRPADLRRIRIALRGEHHAHRRAR